MTPARGISPSLFHHVRHVVRVGTQKQMIWIYAHREVTFMADMHPGWDDTAIQSPRSPMSFHGFSFPVEKTVLLSRLLHPEPNPTTGIWFGNISFLKGRYTIHAYGTQNGTSPSSKSFMGLGAGVTAGRLNLLATGLVPLP